MSYPKSSEELADQEEEQKSQFKGSIGDSRLSWLGIIFAMLLSGLVGWGWNRWFTSQINSATPSPGANQAPQPPSIPVKLSTIATQRVEKSSEFVGTLEASRTVNLKPEISGRVVEILVKEGDEITAQTLILRLDSQELKASLNEAKASLANAQARLQELLAGSRQEEIAQAQAELKQAQTRLKNAQQGTAPEEIAQAQAQLESTQAELELATQRVKRYRSLQREGAISLDQYEAYVKEEKSAIAHVNEAKRKLSQVQKNRGSNIDELTSVVEQNQQKLKQLENGPREETINQARAQVDEAKAKVRNAEVSWQKTQIRAPFAGKIGNIPIKVGDYVEEADELTILTANNLLELNLSVPITEASQLRLGLPVEILDDQGKSVTRGNINFISPNVANNSQVVLAKAFFPNSQGKMLNRQLVQAKIIWNTSPGILVPANAVTRLGGETFVFVAKDGKQGLIAQQRAVKLGSLQGNQYQVQAGLSAGEKIVTAGLLNLSDGAPIKEVP